MSGSKRPRARDLGIPFEGTPGRRNAITDVAGVAVGTSTIIDGKARTGVTAIFPRWKTPKDPVIASWFPLNGNGEMTGTAWIDESGFLEGPVMLTNTHSVGVVRDSVVGWQAKHGTMFQPFSYPIVAETYDGWLNDINGFHVAPRHVEEALAAATDGDVAEGNVGGGTGMVCFGFKGGNGTASRTTHAGRYTVGAFVQANFGRRPQLTIAGVQVGKQILEPPPPTARPTTETGSIIVVVATDAPLLPHQCNRLARRAALGLGRTGGAAGNSSGDIMLAFSTANPGAARPDGTIAKVEMLADEELTQLFDATIFATEEAIINAIVGAETMTGFDDHTVHAIPLDVLVEVMRKAGRLEPRP